MVGGKQATSLLFSLLCFSNLGSIHKRKEGKMEEETKTLITETDFLEHIDDQLDLLNDNLKSIKHSITFFVVIVVLGLIYQFFSFLLP